ncbi:MAG: molecular chaperone DnaJ, partial [Lachnospiraceae bacterium]|nr:molecular chaperone DnaJ [Lachnospiraceae bacterium]
DTRVRLKGKGVPSTRYKDVRGDHYVTLVVQTPDKLSHEAKELLKQFDMATGDSLNAVKRAGMASDDGDKKKKFWK